MAMTSSRGRTSDARTNQLDHMLYVLKRRWRVRVKYVSLPLKLHVVLSIAWIKPMVFLFAVLWSWGCRARWCLVLLINRPPTGGDLTFSWKEGHICTVVLLEVLSQLCHGQLERGKQAQEARCKGGRFYLRLEPANDRFYSKLAGRRRSRAVQRAVLR